MYDILNEVEQKLPWWLEDTSSWQSLYVDYHKPYVERVWRQYGDYRVNLHVIQACEKSEALFHPHPWPSVMRILKGTYQMDVGAGDISSYGSSAEVKPPVVCSLILPTGTVYQMTEQTGWHNVVPIYDNSVSMMISGMPWTKFKRLALGMGLSQRVRLTLEKNVELHPLPDARKLEILNLFKDLYRKLLGYKELL